MKKARAKKFGLQKRLWQKDGFGGARWHETRVRLYRFEMCIDSNNFSPLSIIIFFDMRVLHDFAIPCTRNVNWAFGKQTFAPLLFIHFAFTFRCCKKDYFQCLSSSLPWAALPYFRDLLSCLYFCPLPLHVQVFLIRACECSFSWKFHFNFEVSALLFSSGTGNPLYPLSLSLWSPVHKSSSCWPNLIHALTLVMTHIFGGYALFVSLPLFLLSVLIILCCAASQLIFLCLFRHNCFSVCPTLFLVCHCFVLLFSSVATVSLKASPGFYDRSTYSFRCRTLMTKWKQPKHTAKRSV